GQARRSVAGSAGTGVDVVSRSTGNVADYELKVPAAALGVSGVTHRWSALAGVAQAVIGCGPRRRQHEGPLAVGDGVWSSHAGHLRRARAARAVDVPELVAGQFGVVAKPG